MECGSWKFQRSIMGYLWSVSLSDVHLCRRWTRHSSLCRRTASSTSRLPLWEWWKPESSSSTMHSLKRSGSCHCYRLVLVLTATRLLTLLFLLLFNTYTYSLSHIRTHTRYMFLYATMWPTFQGSTPHPLVSLSPADHLSSEEPVHTKCTDD